MIKVYTNPAAIVVANMLTTSTTVQPIGLSHTLIVCLPIHRVTIVTTRALRCSYSRRITYLPITDMCASPWRETGAHVCSI